MILVFKLMSFLEKCEQDFYFLGFFVEQYFVDDEEVFTFYYLFFEFFLDGQFYFIFVLVYVGIVDVAVFKVNCYFYSFCYLVWRGLKGKGMERTELKLELK